MLLRPGFCYLWFCDVLWVVFLFVWVVGWFYLLFVVRLLCSLFLFGVALLWCLIALVA